LRNENGVIAKLANAVLFENPVLVLALGLSPVIAVGTSLKNGVLLALCTLGVIVPVCFVASLLRGVVPTWLCPPVYSVLAAGVVFPIRLTAEMFTPTTTQSLSVFIPLIAVMSLLMARVEGFAIKNKPAAAALDGLFMGLGYGAVLIVISAVREFFGNGSLWGVKISFMRKLEAFNLPFAGFILLGFFAAGMNHIVQKRRGK
jgi:electron transport complex protein RnfE